MVENSDVEGQLKSSAPRQGLRSAWFQLPPAEFCLEASPVSSATASRTLDIGYCRASMKAGEAPAGLAWQIAPVGLSG